MRADHLRDVLRGPGIAVGRQDAEGVAVPAEGLDERLRVLVEAHALGLGPPDRLVVDVGDVHDVDDLEAPEEQKALEQVLEDVGPPVADMGEIVDRRAAGVELDAPGLDRDEVLDLAAQSVVEPDHPAHLSRSAPYPSTSACQAGASRRG